MNKKTKIILSSAMSIAMCASLITGSTLALFSSEDEVNIAITSGKVDLKAAIKQDSLNLYSYNFDNNTSEAQSTGKFINGGTATFDDDGDLTITDMAPGDKAEFDITITNSSTIDVKYQFIVSGDAGKEEGQKLFSLLEVKSNDVEFIASSFVASKSTNWANWGTTDGKEKTVKLSVELPHSVEDNGGEGSVQGETCTLTFTVKATQGNAKTDNPVAGLNISNYAELVGFRESVNAGNDYAGQTITLSQDIEFPTETSATPGKGRARAAIRRNAPRAAETSWTPIGTASTPFKGTFEGGNHTIKNFKVEATEESAYVGFFGAVDGATIRHLKFVDAEVTATGDAAVAAVVVGQAKGNVEINDVTVTGTVTANGGTATAGGLVGSLEGEETTLTVEGSSFEGTGAEDLVGKTEENTSTTITDSSVTDNDGNKTAWDKGGNHFAEDEEGNKTYFVGSAEDITNLLSKAEGEAVSVTLESDLTLDGSTTLAVGSDLTIDVGGNDLTVKSQGTNAGISVAEGKNLTIKGAESGTVHLDSASSKPAISIKGNGATLDIQGANVSIKNENSGKPAILAENGGLVNLKDSTIGVEGTPSDSSYKEPQIANVTGDGSVLNIENTTVNSKNATAFYVEREGTLNFKSGEINFTGGDFCAAIGFGDGAGKVVFSGGTINIRGDLTGARSGVASGFQDVAIAIGGTTDGNQSEGQLIINGGTINLENTSGTAIAIGGMAGDDCYAYVGDGAVINTHATGSGKAYVSVTGAGFPTWLCYIYSDTVIDGVDDINNFKMLGVFDQLANGYLTYGGVSFETESLPEQYTKAGMGIVAE